MSTNQRRDSTSIAAYYAATRAMDAEAWIAAFAHDAVVVNTVGSLAVTGHQGLRELWTAFSNSLDQIGLTEDFVVSCNGVVAVKWTGHAMDWAGRQAFLEGIDIIESTDTGKIRTLRSYWDPSVLRSQLFTRRAGG